MRLSLVCSILLFRVRDVVINMKGGVEMLVHTHRIQRVRPRSPSQRKWLSIWAKGGGVRISREYARRIYLYTNFPTVDERLEDRKTSERSPVRRHATAYDMRQS